MDKAVHWVTLHPEDVAGHHQLFSKTDCVVDARSQRYDDWSLYPAMIEATVTALVGTHAHYVYVDNLYLYGRPATSQPLNETAPQQPVSVKGQIRWRVEQRLMQAMAQHPITIVRLRDFYAITTDPLPRTLRWFGPPDLPHQFIHIPDAAQAIQWLVEGDLTVGQVWHVAGPDPISGTELRDLARAVSGVKTHLRVMGPITVRLISLGFPPLGVSSKLNIYGNPH